MRKLFSTLTAIVMAGLIVNTASAADRTWDGGGSDDKWSTDANWSDNTEPTSSDRAIFPDLGDPYEVHVDIAPASCSSLDMVADVTLIIDAGQRLEVSGSSSAVDGQIQLDGSGSTFRIMNDHTIAPKTTNLDVVVLRGLHNDAVVDDNASGQKTLTLGTNGTGDARASGAFQFQNLALINNGLIDADLGNGTLRFASSMSYNFASSSGIFAIAAATGTNYAIMRFDIALPENFDFPNKLPAATFGQYGTLDLGVNQCLEVDKPSGTSPYRITVQSGVSVGFNKTCP